MEITTLENIDPKDEKIQLIIKDIETNFTKIKTSIPPELKEEIITLIDKFLLIINNSEKIETKLDILNSIINKISQKIKNFENIDEDLKKYMSQIKKSMFQINSLENRPSIITKNYLNGNYKGDYLNGKREGKGIYIYNNGDKYEGEYKNDLKNGYGVYTYKNGDIYEGYYKDGMRLK